MAESADIIKEFLVALGFKIDQNSLNKFDGALAKSTKTAFAFATVMVGVATAATAMVDKVATKMENLYWSSVRLRDGAANIQDFQLELSKVGGSAEGALSALENMATYLRTNPAGEGLLHNLGVQTRDAQGNLRSTIAIVKDFAHLPMPYWLKVKFASKFGVDERSLQAMIRAAPEAENKLTSLYKRAGIDANVAAESSKDFENRLRNLHGTFDVLATVGEQRMLPMLNKFLDFADWLAGKLLDLDKATGGLSSQFIILTGVLWGVAAAMNAAFGVSIAKMIAGLILNIGVLIEVIGGSEGLVGAFLAVSAAIEATPIGWIITAIALVGLAAAYVITHWDKVKAYYASFVGWFRDKYNTVAKYLGLPAWEAPSQADGAPGKGGANGSNGVAGADGRPVGGQRDFRADEANLGPQSAHGTSQEDTGRAMAFFQKAGWSLQASAGIVANLLHESGLNKNATGDSGHAYGVGQWHEDRQAAFKAWAGHDIRQSTLAEQLAFVNEELTKGQDKGARKAGALLQGIASAAAAGAAVSAYYERPKDVAGEAGKRAHTAAGLVANSRLAPPAKAATTVKIDARTDVKVTGSGDPDTTARAVGREVGRKQGNIARDFAGAVT